MSGVFPEGQGREGVSCPAHLQGLPGGACPLPSPLCHQVKYPVTTQAGSKAHCLRTCWTPTFQLLLSNPWCLVVALETRPAGSKDPPPLCPDVSLPGLPVARGTLAVLPERLPSALLLGLKSVQVHRGPISARKRRCHVCGSQLHFKVAP